MMATTNKFSLPILLGGGIAIGATLGFLGFVIGNQLQSTSAQSVQSEKVAVPTPPARWMLTFNGSIVLGEKFKTETECEQARGQYIKATAAKARSTLELAWGKGYTIDERPYFQADVAKVQALISDAEATYCQSYSI